MSNPFQDSPPPATLSVSELNRQARVLLESHFDYIWVEGEVSNFAAPGSGHWYFSLKDGNAQVRCAMFRNRNQRIRFTPGNGDHLRLRARVSLYEGRGEFQLIVEHAEQAGAGALQAAFEKLKARLLAEGLFDPQRKRPLPAEIRRLGVITSPTGAAIHDILTVLRRRDPGIEVFVLPVAVQGEGAAAQIAASIERANRWHATGKCTLDALLVGRGGGSLEDLWAFNEEVLARAIAASELPVVSAVGHEVDFTIADMVADQRAPTPSAAAELLSEDRRERLAALARLESELQLRMRRKLAAAQTRLGHLQARLKHPGALLREQAQRLDDLEQRLLRAQANQLARHRARLALRDSRLKAASPAARTRQLQRDLAAARQRLESAMHARLRAAGQQLAHFGGLLDSLSPLNTLARGYSILRNGDGKVISDAAQAQPGEALEARLARGRLQLTVTGRSEE
ncbi:exodeoxyribonuclease VII large subunit [Mangrovimicrobium sediminis]|uniref:Exodeoxyribonuclease 7 large subunit n=1 Tax=Mangrovimicrobium sediminis TaxID=2562682 RepID=A0A4Z0M3G5_9GAMM|nr:exodeoxyribonuclease VII large subunit [Haliea sp. SAOS-164]TGD73987.1 exodeoxyribonuclease VII large subunit [Haliea sp. SAOS-164]